MEILSNSDFYFWALLIAGGAWMWGGYFVSLQAHRRIDELKRELFTKGEQIDALAKRVEELERLHNPFHWNRTAN